MTERWTISDSEEGNYYGDYPSKDDAIATGLAELNGDPFWVGKARPPKALSHGIFADEILDQAQENLEDEWQVEWNDFEPTEEQVADLQQRLRAVVDQWFVDHDLSPKWFLVDDVEGIEPCH